MQSRIFNKQVFAIFLLFFLVNSLFAQDKVDEASYIIVTGVGEEAVVPDMAIVTLGVQTRDKSIQVAFAENRKTMQAILNSLHSLKIDKKFIRTNNYSAYLEQQDSKSNKTNQGLYRVTNNIEITVKDIMQVGLVVNTAIENGTNQMHGISFVSSDVEDALVSARKKAVINAYKKAQTLAEEAGVTIIGANKIIEENVDNLPLYRTVNQLSYKQSNVISVGTSNVLASVKIYYLIKQK